MEPGPVPPLTRKTNPRPTPIEPASTAPEHKAVSAPAARGPRKRALVRQYGEYPQILPVEHVIADDKAVTEKLLPMVRKLNQ